MLLRRDGYDATGKRLYFKGKGGDGGAAEQRAAEEARQQKIAQATAAINDQFSGFDDNYYNSIADAYSAYQQPLFDEQVAEARRNLPLGFASTASSDYQRAAANLERDIARQQADLGTGAVDFANKQRASVEQNRSDLVSLANAGTDASAVAQQAIARASGLAATPQISPIADLFSKYAAYANNYNTATQNANTAYRQSTPILFGSSATKNAWSNVN